MIPGILTGIGGYALAAGISIGLIAPLLGVYVTLRGLAYFGSGIAHASLLGVAIGIATGVTPFGAALVVGVLLGVTVYYLHEKTNIAPDAIVGLLFTTGLALGVLIISLTPGDHPPLQEFLFGNISAIGGTELIVIGVLSIVVFVFAVYMRRSLALIALSKEIAWQDGINVLRLDLAFYVLLSLTVVLGVKLAGVLLISALLIVPPMTAKLIARSFTALTVLAVLLGEVSVIGGLAVAGTFSISSGVAIVLASAALFVLMGGGVWFRRLVLPNA